MLEQRRLGGVAVRVGEVETLGGIDELLGLLHNVREVGEHGVGMVSGAWRCALARGEGRERKRARWTRTQR